MLSGVGPLDHLRAHNISVVLDQPLVGQGMSDNPMNAIFIPSPAPVEVSLIQVVGITKFGSYIESASGENFAGGSPKTRDYGMFSPKVHTKPNKIILLGPFQVSCSGFLLYTKALPIFLMSDSNIDWSTLQSATKAKDPGGSGKSNRTDG